MNKPTLTLGLQVGFHGEAVDPQILRTIKKYGAKVARIDLMKQDDITTWSRAQDIIDAGLTPLCIIDRASQLDALPFGTLAEYLNEPDLSSKSSLAYAQEAFRVAVHAQDLDRILYIGVISNLNKRGLSYLSDIPFKVFPEETRVSVHRYPAGDKASDPHEGFKSRMIELLILKDIIGNRKFGISEVGYHTGPRRRSKWLPASLFPKRWTDLEVAENMAFEAEFWSRWADFVIGYQVNDGGLNYGFRDLNGNWKPVLESFFKTESQ